MKTEFEINPANMRFLTQIGGDSIEIKNVDLPSQDAANLTLLIKNKETLRIVVKDKDEV